MANAREKTDKHYKNPHEETTWKIIESILKSNNGIQLIRHHIESYELFLEKYVPEIIEETSKITVKRKKKQLMPNNIINEVMHHYTISFSNVQYGPASYIDKNNKTNILFTSEAYTKNLTYALPTYIDININHKIEPIMPQNDDVRPLIPQNDAKIGQIGPNNPNDVNAQNNNKTLPNLTETNKKFTKQIIAYLPIMKGSKYCNDYQKTKGIGELDKGGYFIIKGNEKVVTAQERIMDNKCFFSVHKGQKLSHIIEIRSNKTMTQMANVLKIMLHIDGTLKISFANLKTPIPLFLLFRYYGVKSDKNIIEYIIGQQRPNHNQNESNHKINNALTDHLFNLLKPSLMEYHKIIHSLLNNYNYIHNNTTITTTINNNEINKHNQAHTATTINNNGMNNNNETNTPQSFDLLSTLVERYICGKFSNPKIKLKYISEYRILSNLDNNEDKLMYFGYMVRKLFNLIDNNAKSIDRDSLTNKKIETTGVLLGQLFKKLWKDSLSSLKNNIFKDSDWTPISNKILKNQIITNKINTSLATGNWDAKNNENKKCGVAQMLKRLTFVSTISHLRRINSPVNQTGKLIDPRKLHNSQFGYCCVAESPEGHQIGLIKNLSLSAVISSYSAPEIIENILKDYEDEAVQWNNCKEDDSTLKTYPGIENFHTSIMNDHSIFTSISFEKLDISQVFVFINGKMVGMTQYPYELINKLKEKRRTGQINSMVSIVFKPITQELNIYTDEGRLLRPLFIVNENNELILSKINKKLKEKLTKTGYKLIDLLNNGIIEYIDANEAETIMIAPDYNTLKNGTNNNTLYSHCELHNSLIFGVSASLIPFAEHNQAPRILYQCAQAKHAIGYNNLAVLKRMDTVNHILHYPQRPLVYTKTSEIIGMSTLPSGSNLIVAINCCGAYNIEDSLIINRGAIERGLFHITTYRTYKSELKKELSILSDEEFCIPNKHNCIDTKMNKYYNKLESNGLAKLGAKVYENDIIIGKRSPIINHKHNNFEQNGRNKIMYKDTSIQMKPRENGIVDKIVLTENIKQESIAKIRIRTTRIPEVGDKCSSRHGQKSTIGIIIDEENMPFSETGIIPDIIINSHCLPSRMTIGQILESVLGKYGAITGEFIDGTPFNNLNSNKQYNFNELDELLLSKGFSGSGRERLYDGETGLEIETKIFIGVTYYQRLKHIVNDKMHARAQGPVTRSTRQPTEGKSRLGGLRVGSMEVDCLHAHGVSHFLHEKFFDDSDKFYVYVCKKCKMIANINLQKQIHNCKTCQSTACDFDKISLPYSSKLLFYELMGMGIVPKFHVN